MTTTYTSLELRSALHDTIEAYHIAIDDPTGRNENHYMMNFIINAVMEDDAEEPCDQIDLEGGIYAHYDGDLRERLIRVLVKFAGK